MGSQWQIASAAGLGSVLAWCGLTATGWALPEDPVATPNAVTAPAIAQNSTPQGYTVLHVNAISGSDRGGDGSQLRPYQTITHALSLADTNSLILLASGVYSAETGEVFPLAMQPGVTIQGMSGPNTASVTIRGNGGYYSNSSGARNITLLSAHNAGLANVTISNPHPEGIGLWIESGSPIILDNAFFQNGLNGIYIAGSGSPVIRGNYFSENGQAGLVIAGPSSAAVEANVFENTGAGITVAPDATPQILNNQIIHNEDGIIIQGSARPQLQGNQIASNRRNSVVDYVSWSDVPATLQSATTQPPPPTYSNGVPAPTPSVPTREAEASPSEAATIAPPPAIPPDDIPEVEPAPDVTDMTVPEPNVTAPALDNTASDRPEESLDIAPTIPDEAAEITTAHSTPLPTVDTRSEGVAGSSADVAAAPASSPALAAATVFSDSLTTELATASSAIARVDITPAITASQGVNRVDADRLAIVTDALSAQTESLMPPDAAPDMVDEAAADEAAFLPLPTDADRSTPEAIAITVTPPPVETIARPTEPVTRNPAAASLSETSSSSARQPLPELPPVLPTTGDQTALRVPSGEIPMGSGGTLPELFTAGAATLTGEAPPPPPNLAASLGLQYRVLVEATDEVTLEAIREHVPDAFRTRREGRIYLQVGAYPTQAEAAAQVERLRQVNVSAEIETIQ